MRAADIIRLRIRSIFSRTVVERELDEELSYHLERQIEEHIAAGMNPEDARQAALRSVDSLEQRREECRDMRGLNLIENLWSDVCFAIRQLYKNARFACTAIFVLALGVCSSAAIYAFADAVLVKPLPYRNPARLVGVFETNLTFPRSNLSYADYLDWKTLNSVFSSLDAYQSTGLMVGTPAGAEPAHGARVTDGFFRTLGVSPVLGRDFYAGEDLPSAPRTALLSYAAWQQRYGGRRDVLGQTVTLDGALNIIIGVLPREFHFAPAGRPEFWTAFHASGGCDSRRSCHGIYGVARLREGVSLQAALANVNSIAKQLEKRYPDSNRDQGGNLALLSEVMVGDIRPTLMVLLFGAGLLLLIAGVNVMGLLLVRSEHRKREIAVRKALGASSARLISQIVTEVSALTAVGCALALVSAYWVVELLRRLIPEDLMAHMPFLDGLGLNGRVVSVAGLISLLMTALLSMPLGQRILSPEMASGLAEASRGSAGNVWRRLGSKLVVLELATAVVLLVGAGLLGKSLFRLLHVDLGMQPDHLATMEVVAPRAKYGKDTQAVALEREIKMRVESLPGVRSVGVVVNGVPLSGNGNTLWFRVLGRPWHGEHYDAPQRYVNAGYFSTLEAKLLHGRYFTDSEDQSQPRVAIINAALAKRYFPDEDPIGKQIAILWTPPQSVQIVGVVEDVREGPLDVTIPAVLYFPFLQSPSADFSLVIRTSQDEVSLLPALAATIRRIDPDIVPLNGMTMNDRISDSSSAYLHRSLVWLVGAFAGLSLLLSVVGIYGVVAYSVSQRSREVGIRIALGAQPRSIYRLILGEAGRLIAVGAVMGLGVSIAATTLLRGLLFEVRSWDVTTLAAGAAMLCIAALGASFIPARRAALTNPAEVMRAE